VIRVLRMIMQAGGQVERLAGLKPGRQFLNQVGQGLVGRTRTT
jgi:hypothetical protein